jgi:hypothetical protein
MEDGMSEIDDAIEQYRRELTAEAALAQGDLAELEDHLRTLADELREQGMPAGEAIAEAARRLGDPKQLAREHARVRSPFGARLSRLRAWSAALLLLPFVWWDLKWAMYSGLVSWSGFQLVLTGTLVLALVIGRTWARPVVLGSLLAMLPWNLAQIAIFPVAPVVVWQALCFAGAIAFLVPWRRGELSPSALALALLGPAYSAAATMLSLYMTARGNSIIHDPWGVIAFASVLAAGAGGLLRARWAAIPAAIGALALAGAAHQLWSLQPRMPSAELWHAMLVGTMIAGAIAFALSARLMWRHSPSRFGSLRSLAS